MNKSTAALAVSLVLLALAAAPPSQACDVVYRLWQPGGHYTYYQFGDTIFLEPGESGHLYLHFKSRSVDPYSTSARIGAPTAFGVGGQRPQDVARVLRLGKHDPRKGKQELVANAVGETALGYQITAVVSPGRLDQIPTRCRVGQVRFTVRRPAGQDHDSDHDAPPPPAAGHDHGHDAPPSAPAGSLSINEAAHTLITDLYVGILRRPAAGARNYPNSFFDDVMDRGLGGLIQIAEEMTASPEFRNVARPGREQALLNEIYRSLYGRGRPSGQERSQDFAGLTACLSGRVGSDVCRRVGGQLVGRRLYVDNNRELLSHWSSGSRRRY